MGQEDINVERHWQYTIGTKSHVINLLDPRAQHDNRDVPRCRMTSKALQEFGTTHVGEDMVDHHHGWAVLLREATSSFRSVGLHDRETRIGQELDNEGSYSSVTLYDKHRSSIHRRLPHLS